jgi:trans-aconitate 2-methyltransferase
MAWDPAQYRKFGGERLRPALDLIARIPLEEAQSIVDLGCGTGNVTKILAEAWPNAQVTGLDNDAAMLEASRKAAPEIKWQAGDIAAWSLEADETYDLIFTNAALHWVPNHRELFPRLLNKLTPGGVLAGQMPNNFALPSHLSIAETVAEDKRRDELFPLLLRHPLLSIAEYRNLLAASASEIDIWETEYLHILNGPDPVREWVKGTALRPLLAVLSPAEGEDFLARLGKRLRQAYPPESDGRTLFPFRRIFLVARRLSAATSP